MEQDERPIVVMKFGGHSVGDPTNPTDVSRIKKVAAYIAQAAQTKRIVVIVSALGDTTDEIITMMKSVNPDLPRRELDQAMHTGEIFAAALLAAALQTFGNNARSMTGYQMKLLAEGQHTKGRIIEIQCIEEMKQMLAKGEILVCAGFQGVDYQGNIITLGRGGSDTSAVALAHVLGAETCEIYTDVDGVYAVDPIIVPNAIRFNFISFSEMLQMSVAGAGVLMDRAVQLARDLNVPLRVLISPSKGETTGGTLVGYRDNTETMIEIDSAARVGLAIRKKVALISVDLLDQPGQLANILEALSEFIVGDYCHAKSKDRAPFSAWVDLDDLEKIQRVLTNWPVRISSNSACLTLVSPDMKEGKAFGARLARSLANVGVNIEMTSSASIGILVIVAEKDLATAAQAIAAEFGLCA